MDSRFYFNCCGSSLVVKVSMMLFCKADEDGWNGAEGKLKASEKSDEVIQQLGMPRRCGYDEYKGKQKE
ncbi:kelch-like protein 24-like protein [Corchorus olitorius]|uniref:Kelch-like protein 24-like protein n=1 Tax=Corchorus olitorius TaxID=93759 RepID=A0A1R3KM75_9ROSI|nr:kelch-like protein 24-like protein [Corchorus olitorius]